MTDFSEPRYPAPEICVNASLPECSHLDHPHPVEEEPDDDGDDDEIVTDPGSFDGGYGPGSYFQHAMRHD